LHKSPPTWEFVDNIERPYRAPPLGRARVVGWTP
jgi:hypothetical protein